MVKRSGIWFSCLRIPSRFASSRVLVLSILRLSINTEPELLFSSRLIIDSRVDFPAPFGPMIAVTPPIGISRDTLSTTIVSPYNLLRLDTLIIDAPFL